MFPRLSFQLLFEFPGSKDNPSEGRKCTLNGKGSEAVSVVVSRCCNPVVAVEGGPTPRRTEREGDCSDLVKSRRLKIALVSLKSIRTQFPHTGCPPQCV